MSRALRLAVPVAFGVLLLVLAGNFYRYLTYVALLVPYPYSLDYGEGIIWEQARLMLGPRMYGDITTYPYIVFHYPPVYHLLARAAAAPGFDLLTAGRVVSVVSGLGTAALLGLLAWLGAPRQAAWWARAGGAAIAGLLPFVLAPFVIWSPLMRVDMVAMLLSFAGVALGVLALRRPQLVYAAVVAFTLAVYTKQTCLSAPLATFGVLLLHDRRLALRGIAFGFALALAILLGLTWWTAGGFPRHILLYNINRFGMAQVMEYVAQQWRLAPLLVVAVAAFAAGLRFLREGWRARIGDGGAGTVTAIAVLQFLAAGAMVITIGKKGASVNYFIEWMCVWCLLTGLLAARLLAAWRAATPARLGASLLLPAVLVGQILFVGLPPTRAFSDPRQRAGMDELAGLVRAADLPVLSDDMVLLLRAGKEIPLEPIIFTDLALNGLWDEGILVDMLARHRLAFVITDDGGPDGQLFRDRFTERVRAEMARSYPHTRRLGRYTLRSPAG